MEFTGDRIEIRDLLARGIIGIGEERTRPQDILVNVTMWVDTRIAGRSDKLDDTVNYYTVAKAIQQHIEAAKPVLVERLAADLVRICCELDRRINAVEISIGKPEAVQFVSSVGVTIRRHRSEVFPNE